MARKFLQGQDWTLAGSGCGISDTTLTLASMTYPNGVTLVTTADIGDLGYMTLEPETAREENISFTTITQNANGTATLTGVTRGLQFKSPYAADAALRLSHAGASIARMTNSAPFYGKVMAVLQNDQTLSGLNTFTQEVTIPAVPVAPTDAASKAYADGLAIAGAPNASTSVQGLVQLATQAENNAGTAVGSTTAPLVGTPAINAVTIQEAKWTFGVDAAGTDAYVITLAPAVPAYVQGSMFIFKAGTANTAAATLNVNGLGAVAITKNAGSALETGDLLANGIYTVTYNSTGPRFDLQTQQSSIPATSVLNSLVTFNSVDLGILTGGPTTDAGSLHKHLKKSIVNTSWAFNTASGNQTIAHGLGRTPNFITIHALITPSTGFSNVVASSTGTYDGSTNQCIYLSAPYDGGFSRPNEGAGSTTSACIFLNSEYSSTSVATQSATATVDATNLTLAWTLTGVGNGVNIQLLIIAE